MPFLKYKDLTLIFAYHANLYSFCLLLTIVRYAVSQFGNSILNTKKFYDKLYLQTEPILIRKRGQKTEMKKIAGFIVLTAIMSMSANVFADEATYTGSSSNSAYLSFAGSAYDTVIITKVPDDSNVPLPDEDIVYAGQYTDSVVSPSTWLLKANPDYGKYKVVLGSETGKKKSMYFYIGIDNMDSANDTPMTRVGEEEITSGLWNVGYVLEISIADYNTANAVKIAYDENEDITYANDGENGSVTVGGYEKYAMKPNLYLGDWPQTISGEGTVKLAFQINYVPEEYKDSITAYLSKSIVSDQKLADVMP